MVGVGLEYGRLKNECGGDNPLKEIWELEGRQSGHWDSQVGGLEPLGAGGGGWTEGLGLGSW